MITTEFIVKDVKKNIKIFCNILGFEVRMAEGHRGKDYWVHLTKDDSSVMLFDIDRMKKEFTGFSDRLGSTALTLMQYPLEQVYQLYKAIKKSRLTIFEHLQTKPYGTVEFGFYLPDGYIIIVTS